MTTIQLTDAPGAGFAPCEVTAWSRCKRCDLHVADPRILTECQPERVGETMTEEQAALIVRYLRDIRKLLALVGTGTVFFVLREFGVLAIAGLG